MVNFPYYLFSFDFLVADIYLGLQTVIHLLHLPIFTPILIIMLNQCMLLPQYKNSLSKAQNPRKVLDIPVAVWNTYSATQGVKADYARINGRLFYSDNNIIIFSHHFLQKANVLLIFSILNRKEYHVCGEYC